MRKIKQILTVTSAMFLVMTGLAFAGEPPVRGTVPLSKVDVTKLPELAKITFSEAMDIAARDGHGRVIAAALENEDGFLVYAVKLATSAKRVTELNIDAGNGKILSREDEKASTKDHDEERD